MLTRHPSQLLARYCDGELPTSEAAAVEAHLATCARCRQECDDIRFAASVMRHVAMISPPPRVWPSIEARRIPSASMRRSVPQWQFALAAALIVIATTAGLYWQLRPGVERPWAVTTQSGDRADSMNRAAGDWVETTDSSRARIVIGAIGTVDVEPNTRVQLGEAAESHYRLSLAHGTINAQVTAPPRIFVVDTPSSTLTDLGCAYRATVGATGTGAVQVTEGWVALEWKGRESLVPAGASAHIRSGVGPGTPTFDDAPAGLKQALLTYEFGDGGESALATVLTEARVRDTLTLWHLLRRVEPEDRPRVYDRLATLVSPPDGVTREGILSLDSSALQRWREELAWKW